MRKLVSALVLGVMALAFSSCRSLSSETLAGEWNVIELNGAAIVPSESTPFLGFDAAEKRIYGFTGCNRLTGMLDMDAFLSGKPKLDNMGATRMLCADDKYERDFLSALGQVAKQRYSHGRLIWLDKDDKVLMRLQKRK